jgi:predicted nucleic acid-binding protein
VSAGAQRPHEESAQSAQARGVTARNVVDSSGWLEYFADGPNADFFADAIQAIDRLIVPSLSIYEVHRRVLRERGQNEALVLSAQMQQGIVVNLTPSIAMAAAKLSVEARLPMADSVMLATARAHQADFWTQDSDFEGMDGVRYARRG